MTLEATKQRYEEESSIMHGGNGSADTCMRNSEAGAEARVPGSEGGKEKEREGLYRN
jgi:hypothetical protein